MRVFRFIILIALIIPQNGFAQAEVPVEGRNYPGISVGYGFGKVFPTNSFVKGENMAGKPINGIRSLSLKMLWQNPGYKSWQKIYDIPYYGIGISVGDLHNPLEIGYPISFYGVLGIPLIRREKLELYTELQFGVASNWVTYNAHTNPMNIAIGSGITAHASVGLRAFYHLSEKVDIGGGFSFSHFSNGGLDRPNYGINIGVPSVDLRYLFGGRPEIPEPEMPDDADLKREFIITGTYSRYQTIQDTLDMYYFTAGGLSPYYLWQNSEVFKSGIGVDLNFLSGLSPNSMGAPGSYGWENLTLGIGYQFEVVFDRLSIVGGIGNYAVHKLYKSFSRFYQRIGVKFYIMENLYAGVNVRAVSFGTAEFMEFNMGYRAWSADRRRKPQ